MTRDELLALPEAAAVEALADEGNWPDDVAELIRREWYTFTPEERLAFLRRSEEIRRRIAPAAFCQWQGRGPDRRRGDSIPPRYRGYWQTRRRYDRNS